MKKLPETSKEIKRVVFCFFLISISYMGIAQELKLEEKYALLTSGKPVIKEFCNNNLNAVWHADSTARTLTLHRLIFSPIDPVAPKYDSTYSTRFFSKYFFNKKGILDSSLSISYALVLSGGRDTKMDTIIDTSVHIYAYALFEDRLLNLKTYRVEQGEKKLSRTTYYGYDPQKRLILKLEDEGCMQYFYSYNDNGQLEEETIGFTTKIRYKYNSDGRKTGSIYGNRKATYEYNSKGKLESWTSDSTKVTYEYNKEQLLTRKTVTGKNTIEKWRYEYE